MVTPVLLLAVRISVILSMLLRMIVIVLVLIRRLTVVTPTHARLIIGRCNRLQSRSVPPPSVLMFFTLASEKYHPPATVPAPPPPHPHTH